MQIRPRDRALLGAVAVIVVLAAFFLLAIKPEHARAKALDAQIATAKTALTTAQSAYSSGRAAQAKLAGDVEQYQAAKWAVPAVSNIPALLRLLQRTAAAADVNIISITPSGASAPVASAVASTASAATPTTGTAATTATATAIPVSLTFGGGYQALNRLVRRLDSLVIESKDHLHASGPLVGISNVSLTPGGASSSSKAPSRASLNISLTATIYQTGGTASASASPTEGSS